MTPADIFLLLLGAGLGFALLPMSVGLVRSFAVEVEDEEAVLVTRFGAHVRTLSTSGWHWLPSRLLPWVSLRRVSLARDFRVLESVHVNDARGTTVTLDLWVELRVVDPVRAAFAVDDWDVALHNVLANQVAAVLSNRDFQEILTDREELGARLRTELAAETERWGIELEQVYLRAVKLLGEVERQVLGTIAARLERAKARVEEEGRQRVALLEAVTGARIARSIALAKAEYPAAVGRAFGVLGRRPAVLEAYNELHALSLLRPHRTVTFQGFGEGEVRAVDAAMLGLSPAEGPIAAFPAASAS